MAKDWIKMRSDLHTHPKVVRISSGLNADRLRTVGGLHAVWSIFDAHSTDGRLDGYTTQVIDQIIGWPGFCDQLIAVEWLSQDSQGVVMPSFGEHNGKSAKVRAEECQRKRMARDSAKRPESVRDLSGKKQDKNGTREEKRREDIREEGNTVRGASSDAPTTGDLLGDAPEKPKRATRLPADWSLPDDWREWSANNTQLTSQQIAIEADKFRDYWTAQPGAKATKTDWQATWRNWCRSARPVNGTAKPSRHNISQIDYGPGGVHDL